jgi:hypothetical protein
LDPKVTRLKSPDECETFARNALERGRPDLADEARRRSVELKAELYGAKSEAEKECLQAIYAYEEALRAKNGKRTTASRTWQMVKRHGILGAVERAVNRESEASGYTALVQMGLPDLAFEAVILRYAQLFSEEAVKRSAARMKQWDQP